MKALFNYIKDRINTRVPNIQTVRVFNNQIEESNAKRKERPFKYPACFVEFIIDGNVQNYGMGLRKIPLRVRFRFAIEGYKFERLDTFDFCDAFIKAIHLMVPTQASGLVFTSFQEITSEFDEDHDNVETPYIDYFTLFTSQVGVWEGVETEIDTVDINTEIE